MKILVTGGGTGGHIYPALSFVDYVRSIDPTAEFLYIGATRGLENKIVPPTGIPFKTLEIQGFKRKLSLDNVKTVQLFLKSYREAKKILREFQPDVVIGTGAMSLVLWSTRHQYLRSQRSSMNKIVFLESLINFDQICGQDCYCFSGCSALFSG